MMGKNWIRNFLILNLYKEMLNIENMYEIIAIILSFILNYAHSIKNSCYTILSYDLMMKFNMLFNNELGLSPTLLLNHILGIQVKIL